MKKTAGKRQEEQGSAWMGVMGSLLKGGLLALAVTLALLLLCAAAVSARWMSQAAMERCVVAVCVLGATVGGALSMRRHREAALVLGVGTGLMLFLLLLSAGILFYEEAPVVQSIPGILCACLCGGGIAGILGRKTKKKRRR